jgi:hypothetical protein
MFCGY